MLLYMEFLHSEQQSNLPLHSEQQNNLPLHSEQQSNLPVSSPGPQYEVSSEYDPH
jgi:hypothetical protein